MGSSLSDTARFHRTLPRQTAYTSEFQADSAQACPDICGPLCNRYVSPFVFIITLLYVNTWQWICLLIADQAHVSSTLLWTCIEEPPPVALLSDELLYCNGKNHLACPNSSLAVIVNQCEALQERGSLFPFVVIAVTALQLLWSAARFKTPMLVHVNQKEETLFWHFSREKGFVTWYFPMSRHLDVQVSLSESISLSYPCTSLSSNLQQSVYHLPGRIYSSILFCPSSIHGGYHRSSLPFYVYDLHFFGK